MKNKKELGQYGLLFIVVIVVVAMGFLLGSASLTVEEMVRGLFGSDGVEGIIMRQIRLPRVLAALLAGIGLGSAGSLLQNVTDNGMASPNIIGVNAGAGFVMILLLYLAPKAVFGLPLAAFCGAFATTLLIVWIAGRMGGAKITILLVGMILTTLLNAGISFISLLDTDVLAMYNHFSIGSLSGVSLKELGFPAALIMVAFVVATVLSGKIKILCLGDALATSMGVSVKPLRLITLVCASALAAAAVSFTGLLGFVGLIVPHMARHFSGGNMRKELIFSAGMGGALVVMADTLGRTLLAPTEIPVGIVMALVGAPFFLFLLLRRGRYAANL